MVVVLVVTSLAGGTAAIQVAAAWTAEFARFPSPVPGIVQLTAQLAEEEARSAALQGQLDQLIAGSADLAAALDEVDLQVGVDTETAGAVRASLVEARARVEKLQEALRKAGAPVPTPGPAQPPGDAVTPPTGNAPTPAPTPSPTPAPATGGSSGTLSVSLVGGDPELRWSACPATNFAAFAVVRSQDAEIHFPAEDRDTLIALITDPGAGSLIDAGAPTRSRSWYRVWCTYLSGTEYKTIWASNTVSIVP